MHSHPDRESGPWWNFQKYEDSIDFQKNTQVQAGRILFLLTSFLGVSVIFRISKKSKFANSQTYLRNKGMAGRAAHIDEARAVFSGFSWKFSKHLENFQKNREWENKIF